MDKTQVKLNRLQGQVAGISKMYEDKRDCLEIVQQILAVRSALSSVAVDLLTSEASHCAKNNSQKDFDRILKSLITNIN